MPSLAKAKEEVLIALSARRLIERGWLAALLGYLAKKDELKVRLKYIGNVRLRRITFELLALATYYASKCRPELPEELAKVVSHIVKPQEAPFLLTTVLSLAPYVCRLQSLGKKASINMSSDKVSLEVNGVSIAFSLYCVSAHSLIDTFAEGDYEVPEVLSGLRGRDIIDVGANVGDTALYFLLNGARKVIAVEPLPNVAKCAEENIRLSSATDRIKVVNAALSNEPVSVPCNIDMWSSGYFSTLKGSGPCKVPGVSLGDLLSMVDDPYLLKMDCEGCEAQVILGPERERLRAFEHIVFETHPHITGMGDEKLLASLKELGFKCDRIVHYLKLNQNTYYCKSTAPKAA